ncbi:MAG: hypothetical protein ACLTER_16625 [Ruminococcus sp.]
MFNHRICQMRSHYPEEIGQALSSRWTVMIRNDFYGIAAVIFAV